MWKNLTDSDFNSILNLWDEPERQQQTRPDNPTRGAVERDIQQCNLVVFVLGYQTVLDWLTTIPGGVRSGTEKFHIFVISVKLSATAGSFFGLFNQGRRM